MGPVDGRREVTLHSSNFKPVIPSMQLGYGNYVRIVTQVPLRTTRKNRCAPGSGKPRNVFLPRIFMPQRPHLDSVSHPRHSLRSDRMAFPALPCPLSACFSRQNSSRPPSDG